MQEALSAIVVHILAMIRHVQQGRTPILRPEQTDHLVHEAVGLPDRIVVGTT